MPGAPKLERRGKRPFCGQQLDWHITKQEAYAAAEAVLEVILECDLHDCTILSRIDAATGVKYLRDSGGKKRHLVWIIVRVAIACLERGIMLLSLHIAGVDNEEADKQSRDLVGVHEYSICKAILQAAQKTYGRLSVDMFAARWNSQLPNYNCHQLNDSQGKYGAFQDVWSQHELMWMFPPPHKPMLSRIIARMERSRAEAVILMPLWPIEAATRALRMVVDTPRLLVATPKMLVRPEAHVYNEEAKELCDRHAWWT